MRQALIVKKADTSYSYVGLVQKVL